MDHPQTTLLTGGTSGIGLELTKQLIAEGHRLIVVARNKERLAALNSTYRTRISCYQYDLSSPQQVDELCKLVSVRHPKLNMIINNAAIQETPGFLDEDFSFDTIELETRINFLAPAWITSRMLPLLLQQNGKFQNLI
ncbi:MAG: SDR family NAD(P)-dependent oxidoreductase [Candidatus Polarisedimenticolaceae bacterium]|nr:SDR family NAD(P)-dependent oxidoreductase [Candidatus Polarisedimenticolaceae bacterium]